MDLGFFHGGFGKLNGLVPLFPGHNQPLKTAPPKVLCSHSPSLVIISDQGLDCQTRPDWFHGGRDGCGGPEVPDWCHPAVIGSPWARAATPLSFAHIGWKVLDLGRKKKGLLRGPSERLMHFPAWP